MNTGAALQDLPELPELPAGACDAHLHVFDGRFPVAAPRAMQAAATARDYLRLRTRLGLTRAVVVQPRAHGVDNQATLDAIRELGPERTRGVAVVRPEITDGQLEALHAGGIRGLRFSLHSDRDAAVALDMLHPLASRIHALGWHLQLHWRADQIVAQRDLLCGLPCPLVFDHMARAGGPGREERTAFSLVRDLVQAGRAWVKLSGPYLNSAQGLGTGYADCEALAQAWVREAPDRLVWGSDWPHVTEGERRPGPELLLRLLARWLPDPAMRRQVLVANACALYGFGD
ncbi:amidohydrolase family protein [Paracidovorax cattleyae]|uniref:amidohydrolase family protein n=1 Tax=Paracidovorax cattleyae TaxID=80868 RepID=UPI0018AF8CCA|nr:amidohydrolase family protein [Paracidovorax cattleyae]MBF9265251.1 amidohydrolase family protein [Paracidovorax cattleyae]